MKKVVCLVCILLLATAGLVGCGGKQVTDYQAYLASTQAMNTPEARAIPVFQVSGITEMRGENISIIQREIIDPVIPRPKKTGWDVASEMIQPLAKLGGIALGVYGAMEIADTIADAAETVVVTNEEVVTVEVPQDPIIVNQPGDPIVIEQPGDPIIIEVPGDPIFVEPWVPPAPEGLDINLTGSLDVNNVTP